MDPQMISAASGMRARMESLEMLANNIANATTGGYKGDREFYSLYVAAEASDPSDRGVALVPDQQPLIDKRWTDYSQGTLRETGSSLDVALHGQGFFAVNGPSGVLYTRNGNFRSSSSGFLTTQDGYAVRNAAGGPIQLDGAGSVEITQNGMIRQGGRNLGQLAVLDYADRQGLDKQGMNYFFSVDPKLKPFTAAATVHQGHLEESNVGAAESAVRLVDVMRQFESLQKAMGIGSDMNKYVIEEVARVSQ